MRARFVLLACLWFAPVRAETIPVWRTPEGRLHLGDRPPRGSVLLEAATFPDASSPATSRTTDEAFARAAADGREILRRRAEQRRAERARAAASEGPARSRQEEPRWIVVVTFEPLPCPKRPPCDGPFPAPAHAPPRRSAPPLRAALAAGPAIPIERAAARTPLGARLW